jgi:signal transduction histidine kinase
LLDLAQIESGVFAIKIQPFDIVRVAEDTLYKFKPLFEQKGITVRRCFPDTLGVNADCRRTEQIITNFLNNAIDHLDERCEIDVAISKRNEPQDCNDNDYVNGGGAVRLSVYNTGDRIPEDIMDKLWESFYKADASRAREYGGTGLGLSIVRAIQDGHNGKYGVINRENGVEFWITLPVCNELSYALFNSNQNVLPLPGSEITP